MRRKISVVPVGCFLAGGVLILSAVFGGCSSGPDLSLAYLGGLTGRNASLGLSGRNGALMAVDEINQGGGAHGHRLKLHIFDDRNDPKVIEALLPRMAELGAHLLIGPMVSGSMENLLPLTVRQQIVVLSPTVSAEAYTGRRDHFFRLVPPTSGQGSRLALEGLRRGWKRAAVAYDLSNRAYTQDVTEKFRSEWRAGGGTIVLEESFQSGLSLDFGSLTETLKTLRPDVLLLVASAPDLALFSQARAQAGLDLPVLSGMWAWSRELLEQGGSAAEGLLLAGYSAGQESNAAFEAFVQKYRALYREDPEFGAVFAYEAVRMAARAWEVNPEADFEEFQTILSELPPQEGLLGALDLDENGENRQPYQIFEVKGGDFIRQND